MSDSRKTKQDLLSEVRQLRARVAELEEKLPAPAPAEDLAKKYEQLRKSLSARTGELMMMNRELARQRSVCEKAEEELKQSQAQLRRFFDESPIGAAIVGLDYRFQRANEEFCRITGYTADEMTSMTFMDITHPDDIEADTGYARALAAGEITQYQMEKRYIRKDGKIIWVWLSVRLFKDQDEEPLYFLPLVQDITERKAAEEALHKSEERYRLHFENVSDVVYITDRDFRLIDVSPSVKGLIGYSPEEIIGRRIPELELLAPEYLETALHNTLRVLEGGKSGPTEYEFITKDGSRKFGEISAAPLRRNGSIIAVIAVARDITGRKRIESELKQYRQRLEEMVERRTEELVQVNEHLRQEISERRKLEETLRNQVEFSEGLVNSSADGIIAFDCECCFTIWNPAMERILCVQKEQVLGKKAFVLFPFLEETGEDRNYLAVLEGKLISSKDRPYYIRETDRQGFYEAHYSPLRNEAGAIVGGLAIIRDITLRKQAEEVLRESEAKYRTLSETLEDMVKKQVAELKQSETLAAIGKMISVVSHEIRNPLQNIRLGFETLRLLSTESEQLEILDDIEGGLNMLTETVEELLDYSRATRLNCTPWNVEAIIRHAVNLLRPKLEKIVIEFDLAHGESKVFIDAEKMSRAMMNLLLNAIEAMPDGGKITVGSRYFEGEQDAFIQISVSDTGCGISEDTILQVAEPFFTTKPRGTGLGLSISKKIVEAHGGSMHITSRPGDGTKVVVVIPAKAQG